MTYSGVVDEEERGFRDSCWNQRGFIEVSGGGGQFSVGPCRERGTWPFTMVFSVFLGKVYWTRGSLSNGN